MKNCPKCSSPLVKDSRSIRCSNTDCMYHLNSFEKKKYYLRLKREDDLTKEKKESEHLSQSERAKRYYYRKKGLKRGYLTIQEAAKLKGVTPDYIVNHLDLFHFRRKPLGIKYDSDFINCNLVNRKKRLRR